MEKKVGVPGECENEKQFTGLLGNFVQSYLKHREESHCLFQFKVLPNLESENLMGEVKFVLLRDIKLKSEFCRNNSPIYAIPVYQFSNGRNIY